MCMNFTISRGEWAVIIVSSPIWFPLVLLGYLGFGVVSGTVSVGKGIKKGSKGAGKHIVHAVEHAGEKITRKHRTPKQVFADIQKNRAEGRAGTVFHSRDVQFYFQRAQRYERELRHDKAIGDYRDILSVDADNCFAMLGIVHNLLAQDTDASLREALSLTETMMGMDFDAPQHQREVVLPSGEHVFARLYAVDVRCYHGTANMMLAKHFPANVGNGRNMMNCYEAAYADFTTCLEEEPLHVMALQQRGVLRGCTLCNSPLSKDENRLPYDSTDPEGFGVQSSPYVQCIDLIKGIEDLELCVRAHGAAPREADFDFQQPIDKVRDYIGMFRDRLRWKMAEKCAIENTEIREVPQELAIEKKDAFPREIHAAIWTLMNLRQKNADGTPKYGTPWNSLDEKLFERIYRQIGQTWREWYVVGLWPLLRDSRAQLTHASERLAEIQARLAAQEEEDEEDAEETASEGAGAGAGAAAVAAADVIPVIDASAGSA